MKVRISANMCDQSTRGVSAALHEPFKRLSESLSGEFGGNMDHLWIDLELIEAHAMKRAPFPFRFQKRVSGRSTLTGLTTPDVFNVGHYSVRPDFQLIRNLPPADLLPYVCDLLFRSTEVLLGKEKRLAGFGVHAFRERFRDVGRSFCPSHSWDAL